MFKSILEEVTQEFQLNYYSKEDFPPYSYKNSKNEISFYDISDWGRVSLLESDVLKSKLKREMIIISSSIKEIPLLVIQYSSFFSRNLLEINFLNISRMDHSINYKSIVDLIDKTPLKKKKSPSSWFDRFSSQGTILFSGKRNHHYILVKQLILEFIKISQEIPYTQNIPLRRKALNSFVEEIFEKGGFGYDATHVALGEIKTKEFYKEHAFLVDKK